MGEKCRRPVLRHAAHSVMAEKDSSTLAADCRAPGLGPCAPELSEPLPLPPQTPELLEVPRLLRTGPLRALFAACAFALIVTLPCIHQSQLVLTSARTKV